MPPVPNSSKKRLALDRISLDGTRALANQLDRDESDPMMIEDFR